MGTGESRLVHVSARSASQLVLGPSYGFGLVLAWYSSRHSSFHLSILKLKLGGDASRTARNGAKRRPP